MSDTMKYSIRVKDLYDNWINIHSVPQNPSGAIQLAERYCIYNRTVEIWYNEEIIWKYNPDTGEKEMSNFHNHVMTRNGNFVSSSLKRSLAEKGIPFTVTAVEGPSYNKNLRCQEWKLVIAFTSEQAEAYGLQTQMTLNFSSGYDSRDASIEALKADIEAEGKCENVIITYDPTFGRNGWFDLGSAHVKAA